MSTVTNNPNVSNSPAFQRWEEKSPSYKRDLAIKIIATAALVTLGLAIFGSGMAVMCSITAIPPALFGAVLITTIVAPAILFCSSLYTGSCLMPYTYHSYHTEKGAKKVCDQIRTQYQTMPLPSYLKTKDGITRKISERGRFKKHSPAWVKYGLMSSESRDKLLAVLNKDKTHRKRFSSIQSLMKDTKCTPTDREDFDREIKEIDQKCQALKSKWEEIMRDDVIPDLPL